MSASLLHEHDAQQGAQSKGEFLGMTGNSSWWLLGSAGVAVFMILVLWGVFGMPLPVCVLAGLGLCGLSLVYVFCLKNDKPAHYDTDFFESVLIEAGVIGIAFGPRARRPDYPFSGKSANAAPAPLAGPVRVARPSTPSAAGAPGRPATPSRELPLEPAPRDPEEARTVPLPTYERLQEQLQQTQEHLEEALSDQGEDVYAA